MRRAAGALLCLAAATGGCGSSSPSGKTSGPGAIRTAATHPAAPRPSAHLVAHSLGALPAAAQLPAVAALSDGRVLVMGGLDAADASVDRVLVIGRHGGAQALATLPQALHDAAGAALGDRAYFIGGGNAGATSSRILRVTPDGRITSEGSLPVGMSDVSAATVGHTIYVVGGFTGTVPLRSILAYTPPRRLQTVAGLPHPVRYAAVAAVGTRVLVAGGTVDGAPTDAVYAFDTASGHLRRIARLPVVLTHAAGASLNGRFYVIGGRTTATGGQQSTIYAIDPVTGAVRSAGHLPLALSDASAASLADRIVLVGGVDSTGGVHSGILGLRPR